jgi:hypothetical protein
MSKYTTEIRFICESLSGLNESVDGARVEEIISSARPKIFDFDYPIFDVNYKEVLESKILLHYYTREIGLETYGLWKLKLNAKLKEIMPYYNKLYESELLEFNPMWTDDYLRSGSESLSQSESTSSSLSTSESDSTSSSSEGSEWNLYQNTPQNGLTGITNYEYLTDATNNKNNGRSSASENKQTASANSGHRLALDTKDYLESVQGRRGNNPSKLLEDYRDTFLNIDMMIINDLEKLFMQLW